MGDQGHLILHGCHVASPIIQWYLIDLFLTCLCNFLNIFYFNYLNSTLPTIIQIFSYDIISFLLTRVFNKPSNKPVKLKKHKMIARAFEKRHQMNNGRLSISFHSTHDDPLGTRIKIRFYSQVHFLQLLPMFHVLVFIANISCVVFSRKIVAMVYHCIKLVYNENNPNTVS